MHQVLIEQSVLGWKEYELEVMRDAADQFVVICSIENLDAMGVHTGDSITVAPAMTLTDREYQRLRDAAKKVLSAVGVATGGSNVQFAVNPRDGKLVVIEMNPRVSRSSALASKATGFPIAKIAALLAVGYTLDEIKNDITRVTPASFEPTIDYVVVKIPRWAFEKFPDADSLLGPQMKSVGEVMALGGTFREALQKAVRGLETGDSRIKRDVAIGDLGQPTADRLFRVVEALRQNWNIGHVASESGYDVWFVEQLRILVETERELARQSLGSLTPGTTAITPSAKDSATAPSATWSGRVSCRCARSGSRKISSPSISVWTPAPPSLKHSRHISIPHMRARSTKREPTGRKKVLILGGGPNRIGQGIEFDYCCVHACYALKELGIETIMLNCNPETVSTDYDTADRLYFEPVTFENVMDVVEREKPDGVLIQFGGQTPLNLACALEDAGVPIYGTSPEAIEIAEDRGRFGALCRELDIPVPDHGTARSLVEARRVAVANRVSRDGAPFVCVGRARDGRLCMMKRTSRISSNRRRAQSISAGPAERVVRGTRPNIRF